MNSESEPKIPQAGSESATERDEGFLRRWSQRKRATAREQSATEAEAAPAPAAVVEKPPLTDADMPPLESLGEKSDFSMFLSSGVSEGLRRQALRKLFLLPSINQRCPLDSEYYDCRGYEPLGNIITHDMREEMERAAQQIKDAAASLLSDDAAADQNAAPKLQEPVRAEPPAVADAPSTKERG